MYKRQVHKNTTQQINTNLLATVTENDSVEKPVSYTHLDVYKRQVEKQVPDFFEKIKTIVYSTL